ERVEEALSRRRQVVAAARPRREETGTQPRPLAENAASELARVVRSRRASHGAPRGRRGCAHVAASSFRPRKPAQWYQRKKVSRIGKPFRRSSSRFSSMRYGISTFSRLSRFVAI